MTAFFRAFIFLVASLAYSVGSDYDITFYNVGQGNCTVVKSPTKKVLFVDAGSSSTVGVHEEVEGYQALASNIVSFIKGDLLTSRWLFFVVSHSDKDHLNLVSPIFSSFFDVDENDSSKEPLGGYEVGVLFGGSKPGYEDKGEGAKLIEFLETYQIKHWFGKTSYIKDIPPSECFVPKNVGVCPSLKAWEGKIEFFSVDAENSYSVGSAKKLKKAELDGGNAVSIVMKMQCGNLSLLLTGDKTKKEIKYLINRFKENNCLDNFKTDILLATHHGSEEDFVEEWAEVTNPHCVVFSSGRSSFSHPRRKAVFEHFSRSKQLWNVKWHFVQFYGDPIDSGDEIRSIFKEKISLEGGERGYTHAVTKKAVFVTGSQGHIRFTSNMVHLTGVLEDEQHLAIHKFVSSPKLPDGITPLSPESISFGGIDGLDLTLLFHNLVGTPSLRELNLEGCPIDESHVDKLCELIDGTACLARLNLKGIAFLQASTQKIRDVWNHRGLILDAV